MATVRLYDVVGIYLKDDHSVSVVLYEDNTENHLKGLPVGINVVGLTTTRDEADNFKVGDKVEITMRVVEP